MISKFKRWWYNLYTNSLIYGGWAFKWERFRKRWKQKHCKHIWEYLNTIPENSYRCVKCGLIKIMGVSVPKDYKPDMSKISESNIDKMCLICGHARVVPQCPICTGYNNFVKRVTE